MKTKEQKTGEAWERGYVYMYAEAIPAESVFLCHCSESMDDIRRWPRVVGGGGGPAGRDEGGR